MTMERLFFRESIKQSYGKTEEGVMVDMQKLVVGVTGGRSYLYRHGTCFQTGGDDLRSDLSGGTGPWQRMRFSIWTSGCRQGIQTRRRKRQKAYHIQKGKLAVSKMP